MRRAWMVAALLVVGCGDEAGPGGTGVAGSAFEPVQGIGEPDVAADALPDEPLPDVVVAPFDVADQDAGPATTLDTGAGGADTPMVDALTEDASSPDTVTPIDTAQPEDVWTPPQDVAAPADVATPPVGSPGDPGPYGAKVQDKVVIDTFDGRKVEATLCLPSLDGGATVAQGPLSLVILSPGFQVDRAQYGWGCKHLATWGFLVVLQSYAGSGLFPDHSAIAQDISKIIDWVGSPKSGLAERWDGSVGTAGHSLGGKLSLLAAAIDPRVGAVAGWDPVDANAPSVTPEMMGDVQAPLLLLGETLDGSGWTACAPTDQNYHQYFEAAKPPALEITVLGADHMDWVDDQNCLPCLACKKGTADHVEVKALTRRTTAAFFLAHLRGSPWMEPWLTGSVMQADVAAGRVTLQQK